MAEKHELVHRNRKEMLLNNFLGGMFWSFGVIVGTALLLGGLTLIAQNINFVPIVGEFVSNVVDYVVVTNRNISE